MSARTVTLPDDVAALADEAVRSGRHPSIVEAIRSGLEAISHEAAIDRWLLEDVLPVLDAQVRDPSRGRSADEVFDRLEAQYRDDEARSGGR